MEKFEQSESLCIFRAILGNCRQNRLCMVPHDGEFHQVGRVEQYVGLLLIGVDPLDFVSSDIGPVGYRLNCGKGTFVIIPNDSSEQSVVTGGYAVVVIE